LSINKNKSGISTLFFVLIIVIAAVLVIAVAFFTGTWPFHNTITREEDYRDFTSVNVDSAFEVEITPSDSYSIVITADNTIMEYIQVRKSGATLIISLPPNILIQDEILKAEITMPVLYTVRFSGATNGRATGFNSTNQLTITLSEASSLYSDIGAGHVDINIDGASHLTGRITTSSDARFRIAGASTVELTGEARNLQVTECSGASSLQLSNFPVTNTNIRLSGASSATIRLDGRLDANLSGASHLTYIGDPTMGNIVTSGGSDISKQ
jgi:hypothetical protein